MADNGLFHIDTIVVNGVAISFEDSAGVLSGAAGFEQTIVPSASGDDKTSRKRVPRILKTKLQWTSSTDVKTFSGLNGAQISMRDSFTGRKCVSNNACFGSIGDMGGGGSVDVTFILLDALQWM